MTNCPPIYRNIQCESFGNKRKITSQMLRQMCKNDAYLYEQVMALWDATDPESRKRFYPPDYMDVSHSFGIESHILAEYEAEEYNYWKEVYRFNRTERYDFIFDFNVGNDRIVEYDAYGNRLKDGNTQYTTIYADSYLDIENGYGEQLLEVVNKDGVSSVRPPISTSTYSETYHHKTKYSVKNATTGSKYVVKQKEKLGKAKKDAHYYGAFNNWNCNNHWYSGFDRTRNYNIKSKWRKDPDSYEIPAVCHAQTFKSESSGRISKVNLNVQGSSSAVSPCIVEIRSTTKKGYPSTKVLGRTEKKFSGSGENIVAFEFTNKAEVKKGETYAIVVRSPLSTFAKTYRWGGWTTGCFSSEKKYYGNGSAFTSEDNGKTWKKNGKTKDTKSYGSHYYDWGINQKPVDFAFEVWVQPITQKEIKEKVPTTNAEKLIKQGYTLQKDGTYRKVLKDAYDETHTYEYTYFKAGHYYAHLKPIQTNPIQNFQIVNTFTDGSNSSPYWRWEYYDSHARQWIEIDSNVVEFNNNVTNYTVLKLRVRCDILQNTFIGAVDNTAPIYSLISANKLANTALTYLQKAVLRINSRPPTRAYLRTLYYHPPQNEILGANIWSEVGVKAKPKGNARVEIDVVHEKVATDHFKFYDLNMLNNIDEDNISLQQEELIYEMNLLINYYRYGSDDASYVSYNATQIINFVYDDYSNTGLFIEYLKNLVTPVYLLPLYHGNSTIPIVFFDKVQLPHLPSYPLNGCEIGDDDIILDENGYSGLSDYGFYYKLDKDISKTLSSIDVTYTSAIDIEETDVVDDNGYEVNVSDVEERLEETLVGLILDKPSSQCYDNGGVLSNVFELDLKVSNGHIVPVTGNETATLGSIDYAIPSDGNMIIFNRKSPVIRKLFPNLASSSYALATTLTSDTSTRNFELKVNLTTKAYQEFVDFEVDYDEGTIDFYNQMSLIHGDFNITYNPLWVRGLSVADFPLKMDLWKENYRVRSNGIYKLKLDVNRDEYITGKLFEPTRIDPYKRTIDNLREYYTLKTSVAPRDNIRKLVVNEGTENERVLVEDSQYFVDYLTNTITFYINDLADGDLITVHYTPNLTDNGLALAYRLYRGRYAEQNGEFVPVDEDDLTEDPLDTDDVYIGMNYFTYRT